MKYKSLFNLWKDSCEKYSELIAFTNSKKSETITYKQAFRQLCYLAEVFHKLGIKRFDNVSLFAVNSVHWLILEQAIITIGAVVVSKSSDMNINELNYVFNNSDSVALVIDNYDVLNFLINKNKDFWEKVKFVLYTGSELIEILNNKLYKLSDILSDLKEETIIKTDWEENSNDIAYINYTSGTSSNPKGAMLPNIGMAYVVEQLQLFNDIESGKLFLGMFPLSSAGGKSVNLLCFSRGCCVMFAPYSEFYTILQDSTPDYFELAPKIIKTIYEKMVDFVNNRGILFKLIFKISYCISAAILYIERKNLFFAVSLKIFKMCFDKIIFKQVRNSMFKDDAVLCIGSAHLAKPLEDFLNILNIKFVQHYGMTETTGLAVSNTLKSQKEHPFSVGIPFEGTTIKIIDPEKHKELKNGEVGLITLQGPEILKEYYNNKEATQKAILPEHFLNTGDLGYLDNDGYLYVLSRYDDVIVMSNGYNVYTPILENEVKDSSYISQVVIVGHGKPYLAALVVLNGNVYKNWCSDNNNNIKIPNNNEEFKNFIIEHINEKIKRKHDYKYYEKIKKVYFLNEDFSSENGLLTSTLKVKYKKVVSKYEKEINSMYKEKSI